MAVRYVARLGFKYAIRSNFLHFLTHTIVDWIDLFTRRELAMVIVDSLNYCVEKKGLEVYVWWRWSFYTGIQTNFKISKKWTGNVQMLYNFDSSLKDGFPEKMAARVGVQYNLK